MARGRRCGGGGGGGGTDARASTIDIRARRDGQLQVATTQPTRSEALCSRRACRPRPHIAYLGCFTKSSPPPLPRQKSPPRQNKFELHWTLPRPRPPATDRSRPRAFLALLRSRGQMMAGFGCWERKERQRATHCEGRLTIPRLSTPRTILNQPSSPHCGRERSSCQ